MYLFVVAVHVLLCILLVLIILLQPGKGGDIGSAFGGGGTSSMFGPRGPTSLLQRATSGVAVMFMVTSVVLALYSNRRLMNNSDVESILSEDEPEEQVPEEAPPEEAPPEE